MNLFLNFEYDKDKGESCFSKYFFPIFFREKSFLIACIPNKTYF